MPPRLIDHLRPSWAPLGVRWLVLMVILFGTVLSSVGGTYSHGIAALTAELHGDPMTSGTTDATAYDSAVSAGHEHSHDHTQGPVDEDGDGELIMVSTGAPVDHSHHGADHSHDKAYALPAAWASASPQLPAWFGVVRSWTEMIEVSRLERPPMG